MIDVAIIGAGPAGLSAAWHLRQQAHTVVVFESTPEVGGRTKSVLVGGVPSNTGALFVYRSTPAEDMAREFSIRTAEFRPGTWGVHYGGQTIVDTDNDLVVTGLPIADEAKADLRAFFGTALSEYRAHANPEEAAELVEEKVGTRLAPLHPQAREILTRAIQGGSVADPSVLSAQYALRYFASYLAHDQGNRLYPIDGMLSIPKALAASLAPGTIRTEMTATELRPSRTGGFEIEFSSGEVLHAREVILAVPSPIAQSLVRDLPDWKLTALSSVLMPGSTTLCITADVSQSPELARWAFVATSGVAFDAVINPQPAIEGEEPATAQYVCYGNSAGYRPDLESDPNAAAAWVEDFLVVAPELRGKILGWHLQTWEHCFSLLTPERTHALDDLRASIGGLHFAGDYTSASAGTHGAYAEGARAAEQVRQRLNPTADRKSDCDGGDL